MSYILPYEFSHEWKRRSKDLSFFPNSLEVSEQSYARLLGLTPLPPSPPALPPLIIGLEILPTVYLDSFPSPSPLIPEVFLSLIHSRAHFILSLVARKPSDALSRVLLAW